MNPAIIGPVWAIIKDVLAGLGIDPEAKAKAHQQAFDMLANGTFEQRTEQALALAQIKVNEADATGASPMQRNARPFIMWVCGVALAFDTIAKPVIAYGAAIAGHPLPPMPNLSSDQLYGLIFGLLGLGGYRTYEKVRGAA